MSAKTDTVAKTVFLGTLVTSTGANIYMGVHDGWQIAVAGGWMPIALIAAEAIVRRNPHLPRLLKGLLIIVAVACVTWSAIHLAEFAGAAGWMAWIFPASIDVMMILAGWAVMMTPAETEAPAPVVEPQVIERVVEVPVEKVVFIEAPSAPAPAPAEEETVETVTETVTRTATRSTRKPALAPEVKAQVIELIRTTDLGAREIMNKLAIDGHTNKITRLPEWAERPTSRG